jgi:archaeal chaperonin
MADKPIYVLPEDSERYMGKDAQRNNIFAAKILAETVKTTLGPKGMDKMLVDRVGNIIVTNDGATILSEMDIKHPVAKMLVEVAKTQDAEVGDGTTTVVMLAGKLLENAEKLLDKKIHPTIITRGYKMAADKALDFLEELSSEVSSEEELLKIAQTAMTGKGAEFIKEHLDSLVVEAVKSVLNNGQIDLEDIKIEKQKGGAIKDSELVKGIVLDKERTSIEMPEKIINARIALLDCALEIKPLDRETRISINSPDQLQSFMVQEEELMTQMINKVIESNANVVICQKGIDDIAQFYLAKKGIYALRRVAKSDMQKIARATGGKIVSSLRDISSSELGFAESIEGKKWGEEGLTYITGCKNPRAVTILVKGGTEHVIDEIGRAIRDALGDVSAVIRDQRIVAGGGAIEIELSRRLRLFAQTLKGREQIAVEEFASALEFIPVTLAENAGLDPLDLLTELRVNHESGNKNFGLNLFSGKVEDTMLKGIIEPLKIKKQAINSASEVAIMILRIDDVIASNNENSRTSNMAGYD